MLKESKKILSLSLASALSAVVFVTTGFAASSNVSGYEKAKESIFALKGMENYTSNMEVSVQEDGIEIMRGTLSGNVSDKLNHSMTMDFTVEGESYTVNTYTTPQHIYTKSIDSDSYYKTPNYMPAIDREGGFNLSDNQKQLVNILLDMFAGDAKNYFTHNDGKITMALEKGQIPEIFQVGLSVLSEAANKELNENPALLSRRDDENSADAFFMDRLLNHINNPEIDSVYAEGTIDENNILTDVSLTFTLTGEDAEGNPHITTVAIENVVSDIGATELAPFDETDKKIIYSQTWPKDYRVFMDQDGNQNAIYVGSGNTNGEILTYTITLGSEEVE